MSKTRNCPKGYTMKDGVCVEGTNGNLKFQPPTGIQHCPLGHRWNTIIQECEYAGDMLYGNKPKYTCCDGGYSCPSGQTCKGFHPFCHCQNAGTV